MSTSKAIREQVERCRWFSAEEAVQWALGAYYKAVAELEPPEGEEWDEDGCEWASPALFGNSFVVCLSERIRTEGVDRGIVSDQIIDFTDDDDFAAVQDHKLPPAKNPGNNALELGVGGAS